MTVADRYTMLISSLPAHAPLFSAKLTPLSRIRLEERLRMLTLEDAAQLELVQGALDWGRISDAENDGEIYELSRSTLQSLRSGFLREIVRDRLELRTVVAALRRRRLGAAPPDTREHWGFGRWLAQIRRNWKDPTFQLEPVFPWASEANRLLQSGHWVELERLLLGYVWTDLGRRSEGHYFDLEAVVIYVLRWNLVARWTGYEAHVAGERFRELVAQAMDDRVARALNEQIALLN